jgi:hypothetical protein
MNTKEYQTIIFELLKGIFNPKYVNKEWDSAKYDLHLSKHKGGYYPRPDIAVGPFNSYADLDMGIDNSDVMKEHPFTKRIVEEIAWEREDFKKCWNNFSRCYLAIEIELGSSRKTSNSLKHILGSIINASVTGSIGIVITDKSTKNKVDRLYSYLLTLEGLERLQINTLGNLVRIDKDDFILVLSDIKEKLKKL